MLVPVYDIANCGPRHRFVANGKLVHNSDKVNLQNLPSRGPNAKKIKKTIMAPDGHLLIDCDSSQIEARVLAWLAGQDDLVEDFAQKKDVYKKMASAIYGVAEDDIDTAKRHVGKTVVLGCGYGTGWRKFQATMKVGVPPMDIAEGEAQRIISVYREANHRIVALWREAQNCIAELARGDAAPIGRAGVLSAVPDETAIRLPSGLLIRYNGLRAEPREDYGHEYFYNTRRGPKRIYGPACVENVVQGIARCVVGEQMIQIAKRYRVVLTVHDSVVVCVREEEAEEAKAYVEQCMSTPPKWAAGLPVACEAGVARRYGDT